MALAMLGKRVPFLLGTLLCFISAPPVSTLQALDVHSKDESIEINADGTIKNVLNVQAEATIVLGDKGSNSCPSGSTEFTGLECAQLGAVTYPGLRAGYYGTGSYGYAGTWGADTTGCFSLGSVYFFNRGKSSTPGPNEFKLCKANQINADVATKKNIAASIEINADGESLANEDAATTATSANADGHLDEQGAVATKKEVQAIACVDSSSRRRSGLSCARLAGTVDHQATGYTGRVQWPTDFTRDMANFCGSTSTNDQDGATIEAGEAAAHCCATCATAPVFISFGGSARGTDSFGALGRPEELRTFQCQSAGNCQPCTSTSNCWHGGRRLDVRVAGGTAFAFYRAVVHAVCPPGVGAQWAVWVTNDLTNGELKVYADDVLEKTLSHTMNNVAGDTWHHPMSNGHNKLHIDFTPANRAQESYAECGLSAQKVSASFERCQDQKNCLRIFGDGSEAAFAMRNSNENQILCLTGGSMTDALQTKCSEWKACMLAADDLIETEDRTAENVAVAIEPEIALVEVAYLEKMAKKEERKAMQAAQEADSTETALVDEKVGSLDAIVHGKSPVVARLYQGPSCTGRRKTLRVSDFKGGRVDDGWSRCNQKWDDGSPVTVGRSFKIAAGFAVSLPPSQQCNDQTNRDGGHVYGPNFGANDKVFHGATCKRRNRAGGPIQFMRYDVDLIVATLYQNNACGGKTKTLRIGNFKDGRVADGWSWCFEKWDDGSRMTTPTAHSFQVHSGFDIAVPPHQGCNDQLNYGQTYSATAFGANDHIFHGGGGCKQTVSGRPVSFIRYRSAPVSRGQKLIHFLTAMLHSAGAGTQGGSLARSAVAAEKKTVQAPDAANCFDPTDGDMEAWDCECMDEMIDSCGGIDENCFVNHMCRHPNVCGSWKTTDGHCPGTLLESMAKRSILQTNTNVTTEHMNNVRLDSTLAGKCTSETQ